MLIYHEGLRRNLQEGQLKLILKDEWVELEMQVRGDGEDRRHRGRLESLVLVRKDLAQKGTPKAKS